MQGVSVRGSTGETPCHRDVPSAAPRGQRSESGGITGWQLSDRYYTQPANSDGVYSNARAAPGLLTVQPSVHWSGQGGKWHTNTHSFLREPCTFADGKKRAHRALWRKVDWIMCEGWGSETTTGDLTNQPVGELKVQREAKLFMRAQLLT